MSLAFSPHIKSNAVRRYHVFHNTDTAEQKDPSCKPMLGIEKYFDAKLHALPNVRAWAAPCKKSQSVEHGGIDDDRATRESVVGLIRGRGCNLKQASLIEQQVHTCNKGTVFEAIDIRDVVLFWQ